MALSLYKAKTLCGVLFFSTLRIEYIEYCMFSNAFQICIFKNRKHVYV